MSSLLENPQSSVLFYQWKLKISVHAANETNPFISFGDHVFDQTDAYSLAIMRSVCTACLYAQRLFAFSTVLHWMVRVSTHLKISHNHHIRHAEGSNLEI
jgi:hypothetical protein